MPDDLPPKRRISIVLLVLGFVILVPLWVVFGGEQESRTVLFWLFVAMAAGLVMAGVGGTFSLGAGKRKITGGGVAVFLVIFMGGAFKDGAMSLGLGPKVDPTPPPSGPPGPETGPTPGTGDTDPRMVKGASVAPPPPPSPPNPSEWFCLCYTSVDGQGHRLPTTACRPTPAQCERLARRVQTGTRELVKDSVSRACTRIEGIHPADGLGGAGGWANSAHPGSWVSTGQCWIR